MPGRLMSLFAHFYKMTPKHGRQRGYLLLEYVFGLAVGALLAVVVAAGLGRSVSSWQFLVEQLSLQQAGHYIQGFLEKHLAYNATAIKIKRAGNIEAATILGNKKLLFYINNKGLYLRTTTKSGSGSNPMFLPDYPLSQWQVQRVNANTLCVRFSLQGKHGEASFAQVLTCYNGAITDEQI